MSRARIVTAARAWIGTPYRHQASLRGVGADCVGFVRGVYREVTGADPEPLAPYTRDWAEASGSETLLEAARRHLREIDPGAARAGDVLVFRYRRANVAKHAGLLTGPGHMIHALEGACVCEVAVCAWWRRHLAAAFAFPGVGSET